MKHLFVSTVAAILLGGCASASQAVLLDVRSVEEFRSGHLQSAINIPHDRIEAEISRHIPDKSTPLQIYCRSGRRVKIAVKTLSGLGYENLKDLGGINDASRITNLPIKPVER